MADRLSHTNAAVCRKTVLRGRDVPPHGVSRRGGEGVVRSGGVGGGGAVRSWRSPDAVAPFSSSAAFALARFCFALWGLFSLTLDLPPKLCSHHRTVDNVTSCTPTQGKLPLAGVQLVTLPTVRQQGVKYPLLAYSW